MDLIQVQKLIEEEYNILLKKAKINYSSDKFNITQKKKRNFSEKMEQLTL